MRLQEPNLLLDWRGGGRLKSCRSRRAGLNHNNTKVFNLCFIQRQGLEKFPEVGPEIKRRYYRGKMDIGKGPQLQWLCVRETSWCGEGPQVDLSPYC